MHQDRFLQKQILLLALERLTEGRKDIGAVHVEMLMQLFTRTGNGQYDLPYGLQAYREYDKVRIEKCRREKPAQNLASVEIKIPGTVQWPGGIQLSAGLFPYEKSQKIVQKTYTKWFDYDKIVKSLVLRTRLSGDYLEISSNGGRKALKSYFIDEKIPKAERDSIPVIADGNHILWVVGKRISEHYKIDEKTKTVLQLQITGGQSDGREG